jgi:hypothetical protein
MTTQQLVKKLGFKKYGGWTADTGPSYINDEFVIISSRRRTGTRNHKYYAESWAAYKKSDSGVKWRSQGLKTLLQQLEKLIVPCEIKE